MTGLEYLRFSEAWMRKCESLEDEGAFFSWTFRGDRLIVSFGSRLRSLTDQVK